MSGQSEQDHGTVLEEHREDAEPEVSDDRRDQREDGVGGCFHDQMHLKELVLDSIHTAAREGTPKMGVISTPPMPAAAYSRK